MTYLIQEKLALPPDEWKRFRVRIYLLPFLACIIFWVIAEDLFDTFAYYWIGNIFFILYIIPFRIALSRLVRTTYPGEEDDYIGENPRFFSIFSFTIMSPDNLDNKEHEKLLRASARVARLTIYSTLMFILSFPASIAFAVLIILLPSFWELGVDWLLELIN